MHIIIIIIIIITSGDASEKGRHYRKLPHWKHVDNIKHMNY